MILKIPRSGSRQTLEVRPNGPLVIDSNGDVLSPGRLCMEIFEMAPVAVGSVVHDERVFLIGTGGTASVDPATVVKGGVKLSVAADTNEALVYSKDTGPLHVNINPAVQPVLLAQMSIASLTAAYASVGFDENVTVVDPSQTAGDGVAFVYCPYASAALMTVDPTSNPNATALTEAQMANWMIEEKVNGTDYWYPTAVPVIADVDYALRIEIGKDLKAKYYINGELVYTGTNALTSGDEIKAKAGVTGIGGASSAQLRYLGVGRLVG